MTNYENVKHLISLLYRYFTVGLYKVKRKFARCSHCSREAKIHSQEKKKIEDIQQKNNKTQNITVLIKQNNIFRYTNLKKKKKVPPGRDKLLP